jgi:uncharacterized protein YdhG (YjbR/CyaY superfamily)
MPLCASYVVKKSKRQSFYYLIKGLTQLPEKLAKTLTLYGSTDQNNIHMATTKATNVDDYVAGFPKETQKVLEQIRATIKKALSDSEETISYAIPTFKQKGKPVIYFAGYKNHVSIYPAPRENEAFKKELSAYKGGKGTVQFPLDKPIPSSLITKIVKFRVKENEELAEQKKLAKKTAKR